MGLFKSKLEREADRRLVLRKARKSFDRTLARLDKQRERYRLLGQAAARNGSRDKVKLIARAIQRCNQFEKQVEAARSTMELFETQRELSKVKASFGSIMDSARGALLDARSTSEMARLAIEGERAMLDREEIESLVEALADTGGSRLDEPNENEDLRMIEEAMLGATRPKVSAGAKAPAQEIEEPEPQDDIDRDLKQLERELNMGA
jgi:hypothetical protein